MAEAVSLMNAEAARSVVEKASAASSRVSIRSCFIGILGPFCWSWLVVGGENCGMLRGVMQGGRETPLCCGVGWRGLRLLGWSRERGLLKVSILYKKNRLIKWPLISI